EDLRKRRQVREVGGLQGSGSQSDFDGTRSVIMSRVGMVELSVVAKEDEKENEALETEWERSRSVLSVTKLAGDDSAMRSGRMRADRAMLGSASKTLSFMGPPPLTHLDDLMPVLECSWTSVRNEGRSTPQNRMGEGRGCRELMEGRKKLEADINNPGVDMDENYPPLNSAFILFDQQIGAHIAAQITVHNEPYRMADKYTKAALADITEGSWNQSVRCAVRRVLSDAATAALIMFWTIPVAFVSIISNVSQFCVKVEWLHWLCGLPSVVIGIISGVLPPVALAILFMLLSIVLRLLAHFEGIPCRTGIELSLMTRLFIFQVVRCPARSAQQPVLPDLCDLAGFKWER
ncbi:hypothetical protein FRC07_008627, partial [Ceratobasidium sp. 392]